LSIVNCKCNGIKGVEAKFKTALFDKARRDAPREILSNLLAKLIAVCEGYCCCIRLEEDA
jgi:hypothetical protein